MLYPITMFLPASIIAFMFVIFWSIVYPDAFMGSLKLESLNDPLYPSTFARYFVTIFSYVFVFLSLNLIGYLFTWALA